jgi:hypothetical protein
MKWSQEKLGTCVSFNIMQSPLFLGLLQPYGHGGITAPSSPVNTSPWVRAGRTGSQLPKPTLAPWSPGHLVTKTLCMRAKGRRLSEEDAEDVTPRGSMALGDFN